jgi:hypothetical protein
MCHREEILRRDSAAQGDRMEAMTSEMRTHARVITVLPVVNIVIVM